MPIAKCEIRHVAKNIIRLSSRLPNVREKCVKPLSVHKVGVFWMFLSIGTIHSPIRQGG